VLAGRRLYLAITIVYLVSRVVLLLVGVRYHADYLWQHFHDPDLLVHRLWETLYYTHAFTPFINLFVGVVLKISVTHSVAIYQGVFLVLGLAFVNALAYLLEVFAVRGWPALALVTFFALSPPFIYFENFLHYEFMAASLLAVAAALFHRALVTGAFRWWAAFFLDCALIAYVRTTFHLVWLLFFTGLAIAFQHRRFRTIAAAAVLPIVLVVALYAKNKVVFGFFGTSSMFGFNLAYMTTKQMSAEERQEWVDLGKLHPIATINLFAPPEAYARYVDLSKKTGIPVLDRTHRQNGQPNFNHWSYVELSKLRMEDNHYFIAHHFWRYLDTVRQGWVDYFRPTTRWHPQDEESSPHRENRRVLGGWENAYNRLFHTLPWPPFGLYLLLVPALIWATARALRTLWRQRLADAAAAKTMVFFFVNCLYVPLLSCLVTIGELERYRFMVEGFLWVAAAALVRELVSAAGPRGPRAPAAP
jgi:hypothetical protein